MRCEVLVIGGGTTGAGIARDLSMRGVEVVLLEKNDFSTGATGRSQGMLHSGARYAVKDPDSARECAEENAILKEIAPFCVEDTGGMFIGLDPSDVDYLDPFLRGCRATGVGATELGLDEAFEMEPDISPYTQAAVYVPDAYVDPFLLTRSNVAEARALGAQVRNHCQVVGMELWEEEVIEVRIRDRRSTFLEVIKPEIVVNATGAWGDMIASMVGLRIPIRVDKGSLVILNGRKTKGLVNRLRPPSDGDIIVPSHSSSIAGTTCMEVSGPDDCHATMEEVLIIMREVAKMVPSLEGARAVRAYAGIRPLPADSDEGRDISRVFKLLDHSTDGVDNMISIIGGKLTTYRLMAEKVSDAVMSKLGRKGDCRTAKVGLGAECPHHDLEGLNAINASRIAAKYGADCTLISEKCRSEPRGMETLCSCEQVLRGEAVYFAASEDVMSLADLLRRTRAGMGYCQSGMCVLRSLSVMEEAGADPLPLLEEFMEERWNGVSPVVFDSQLRQEIFKLHLNVSLSLENGGEEH